MNKKGFTLVELLAVIVVLGILLTISVISVNTISNSQKEKLYKSKVQAIETAGKMYLQDHPDKTYVLTGTLKDEGYIDDIVDPFLNQDFDNMLSLYIENNGSKKVYNAKFVDANNNINNWYFSYSKGIITLEEYKGNEENIEIYSRYYVDQDTANNFNDSNYHITEGVYEAKFSPYALKNNDKKEEIKAVLFMERIKGSIKNFESMFEGYENLKYVDFGQLSIKPNIMKDMFKNCESLGKDNSDIVGNNSSSDSPINFGNLDTSNVNDISGMFAGCSSLKKIDLSYLNLEKVTKMFAMFSGCTNLKTIDLSSIDINNVNTYYRDIFSGFNGQVTLTVRNDSEWDNVLSGKCEKTTCKDNACTYTCNIS